MLIDELASAEDLASALRQLPRQVRDTLRRALVLADEPQSPLIPDGDNDQLRVEGSVQLPIDIMARIIPAALGAHLNDVALTCIEWRQLARSIPRKLWPLSSKDLRNSKGMQFVKTGGVFICCGNELGEDGAAPLAAVIADSAITCLELYDNEICPSGVMALAAALSRTRITSLDLGYNGMLDQGAIALAEVIPETMITNLSLRSNHIGPEGATSLFRSLPGSCVTTLNLRYNEIGPAGALALAFALPECQIQSLHLGYCHVGDVGVLAIAAKLGSSKIQDLNLEYNSIGTEGAMALASVLEDRCCSLHALNLVGNTGCGIAGRSALQAAIDVIVSAGEVFVLKV